MHDGTNHAGSYVERSLAEKQDTVWLCSTPVAVAVVKRALELQYFDDSKIYLVMVKDGNVKTSVGFCLIRVRKKKRPEEQLNIFDGVDSNCCLQLSGVTSGFEEQKRGEHIVTISLLLILNIKGSYSGWEVIFLKFHLWPPHPSNQPSTRNGGVNPF